MKPIKTTHTLIALCLWASPMPGAEPPADDLSGLARTASDFVVAYNNQDAAAAAALFMENGEIVDISGESITSGREAITARYREIFAQPPQRIAIEVDSVRLVTPTLAIEEGIYHLTPADDRTAPPRSTAYTAVLARDTDGTWRIASTRSLKDVTEAAGRLAGLADVLKGEWTFRDADGVQLDLAFGWDASGNFLTGEMLTTAADAEPQQGSIRIAWDAAKERIVSWMFDAQGGFTHGVWTPAEDGWLIRSEGTTADGEALSASQKLAAEGRETLIWSATHRVINGEQIPDKTIRMVRQAPEPDEE